MSVKSYESAKITVSFDSQRCIHAAECVSRLPAVFDVHKRPWIQPDQADVDEITAVVERCPSGALQYQWQDRNQAEQPSAVNLITLQPDGPVYLRGQLELESAGQTSNETRLALCRCGRSQNKPYCDNSHQKGENPFKASGHMPAPAPTLEANQERGGTLKITPLANGPVLLNGHYEIQDAATGETVYQSQKGALCRCGGSLNKPFCDGTHRTLDFSSE